MKQEITCADFMELEEKHRTKLYNWSKNKGYLNKHGNPCLSIGQMIEFLGEDWHDYVIKEVKDYGDIQIPYSPEELCDALREGVKKQLKV